MSKRILFFGNERLATGVTTQAPTLRALIEAGYDVAAVVVAQNPLDKSRQARHLEIEQAATEHSIKVISPDDLPAAREELASFKADIAVLIAYGKLVPPEIISLFPAGIINVHPSLLPLHRGSTPLESVILSGEKQTGVSLMQLAQKMDSGPVFSQQTVDLQGSESKQSLADKLSLVGSQLVVQNLPAILSGDLKPQPQDESAATYDEHIDKADGQLDWSKPAVQLEREVRAFAGWPRSRASLGVADVIVTKAHVKESQGQPGNLQIQNKELGVYTAKDILVIDSLIPAGKKEMSAEAFLAGYKTS